MAAYEIPGLPFSLPANVDLSSSQFCAVDATGTITSGVEANNGAAAALPAAGGTIVGIVQNNPTLGVAATIVTNGISKAVYGGTITVDALLMVNTSGQFVVATTGNFAVAKALIAGVSGVIGTVLLQNNGKQ